ncbi:hypothetical protein [Actinoplanes sp. NPDC026670]|uniref:hypothetical protein n=1 Tax=Actinoplanes sp. NPDC026670 TaxID=3154700 RepID=UPI0033E54AC9
MRTSTSRAVGASVALAALAGLAACTPADRPLLALRTAGGEPVMLIVSCDDFRIGRIYLYPLGDNPAVAVDGPERELERTGSAVPDSMPLFGEPPAGWAVTDDRLTALAPAQRYSLFAGTPDGDDTVPIAFTDADLAGLGPDEVLVGKAPISHQRMTEQEFREQGEKDC